MADKAWTDDTVNSTNWTNDSVVSTSYTDEHFQTRVYTLLLETSDVLLLEDATSLYLQTP